MAWISNLVAYPTLVSERLNAEKRVMALGGWGVYRSWDNRPECTMGRIYDKLCAVVTGGDMWPSINVFLYTQTEGHTYLQRLQKLRNLFVIAVGIKEIASLLCILVFLHILRIITIYTGTSRVVTSYQLLTPVFLECCEYTFRSKLLQKRFNEVDEGVFIIHSLDAPELWA